MEFLQQKRFYGINNKEIDGYFGKVRQQAIEYRKGRNQKSEIYNTCKRRWGESIAERVHSDPSINPSIVKVMNQAYPSINDVGTALRMLNNAIIERLSDNTLTRNTQKVHRMTVADWKKVMSRKVSSDTISISKLKSLGMYVDEFGFLLGEINRVL